MSLTAGARLGPYEIVSPLGAGGMGEVYRAKDGRLNRTVAIKILSDESAADADRRERFEREAKAISALDHPHICALYDVGDHEGTYFLVMPCIEGQTLADRIAKGALPPDQAIKHAIEIATALDAAHRHGIIHRDLKPGNIMLTRTGVKLLDFGLAKLKKAPGPLGDTTIAKGTGIGTLLGTMPYMAPEQIEGRDVDARSDIFSLGAVIYEMVTGQRAFKGDSPASVIGAIMKDEPAPIRTLQPLAPSALDHVVTVCLAKDPDERWQSAADIARELKWVTQDASGSITQSMPVQPRRLAGPLIVAAAVGAALAVGAMALSALRREVPTLEIVRFPLQPPPNAAFTPTRSSVPITQVAVSPNGRHIAFAAAQTGRRSTLWIRTLDDVAPRPLAGTESGADPFWSPDSQHLGFFANGRLKRIELANGSIRDICEASLNSRGGTWSTDGVIVFGDAAASLRKVSENGGTVTDATTVPAGENSHRWPWFLPDGRRFLYFARGEAQNRGIYVGSLDAQPPVQLIESTSSALYASGQLMTVRDGALLAYPFDERTATITGEPTTVASQVASSSTQQAPVSVSTNGVLAYGAPLQNVTELVWFDRAGKQLGPALQSGNFVNFRLSPDEQAAAVTRIDTLNNTSDIWLVDLQRSVPSRLTLDPLNDMAPVWSPDQSRIVFRSDRDGGNWLFGAAYRGGAREELLLKREISMPTDWSYDGKHLVYHNTVASTGLDISAVRLETDRSTIKISADRPTIPIIQTRFDEYDGHLSPDGRWIAYTSEESGSPEVYVQSFPSSSTKTTVSVAGGAEPRWRRDGRELFYVSPERNLMCVAITTSSTFETAVARSLFPVRIPSFANPYRSNIDVSADGQRFLINVGAETDQTTPITVVLNWTAALPQK